MSQLPLERTENAAIRRRPQKLWLPFAEFYSVPLKLLRPLRAALSNFCYRARGAANLNHPQSEFVKIYQQIPKFFSVFSEWNLSSVYLSEFLRCEVIFTFNLM
jgi:hypothetical protein